MFILLSLLSVKLIALFIILHERNYFPQNAYRSPGNKQKQNETKNTQTKRSETKPTNQPTKQTTPATPLTPKKEKEKRKRRKQKEKRNTHTHTHTHKERKKKNTLMLSTDVVLKRPGGIYPKSASRILGRPYIWIRHSSDVSHTAKCHCWFEDTNGVFAVSPGWSEHAANISADWVYSPSSPPLPPLPPPPPMVL